MEVIVKKPNHTLNKSKKRTYLEILRIIAAFFVIVNHTINSVFLYSNISKTWYVSAFYLFASKIAVPVFLMISGALLLSKKDSPKKYFTRVTRLAVVIILFTIINYIYIYHKQNMSLSSFIISLFNSVTNAYWYLYLYFGILIMLPILQKIALVLSKGELQLFLFISLVIGGGIPLLEIFTNISVQPDFLSVLFSPYLGIMFLGHYIEKYLNVTKPLALFSLLVFLVLTVLQVLLTKHLHTLDPNNYLQLDNRTLLTITTSSACVYIFVKYIFTSVKLSSTLDKTINYIGSLTFGIYLFGDMFIRILSPLYSSMTSYMHIMLAVFLFEIGVFLCGAICTAILKKIPYIKKLL